MKLGRIIFLILFVGAISWGYVRSMQPIVRYDAAAPPPATAAAVAAADRGFAAEAVDGSLYATVWDADGYVKIQGVYKSPHDGAVEVAVFRRDREADEPPGQDTIRIRLSMKEWPAELVFRDVTGNLLARAPVAGVPESAQ